MDLSTAHIVPVIPVQKDMAIKQRPLLAQTPRSGRISLESTRIGLDQLPRMSCSRLLSMNLLVFGNIYRIGKMSFDISTETIQGLSRAMNSQRL
ncbi:hypothetical protein HHX47_DHR1001154 [Lentinula edodes]|nr:hypothetical protein HHX47_DHR1001154 [Lentinula edodes]